MFLPRICRATVRSVLAPAALVAMIPALNASAADVTWNNGGGNFLWDTTSPNWSGAPWNNAAGDGAIFGSAGIGSINVVGPVNVDSIFFTDGGYQLNGVGPINFVNGVSTQTTGVVNVTSGFGAQINAPITNNTGFQKIGGGSLELTGANTFTGAFPITGNGNRVVDVLVGGSFGTISGGTLRVASQASIPATTRVSIGTGYLDIGSNNITLRDLIFTNQNPIAPWNTTLNANNGVIGSGTLRVTNEIHVLGVTGNNAGNSIAANVDLGGGTQIIRVGLISSIGLNQALMFTGSISNGTLLKTIGFTAAGTFGSIDGMSLFGNNTYTGATILNSGSNVATGINQSSSIKVAGLAPVPGSALVLGGANGSFPAAQTIQALSGASFVLDNTASFGSSGNSQPNIPAAINNNRISDTANIELRDGNLLYRNGTGAASETFGSLNASGGHNSLTLTIGTGGAATLTASGNLSLGSRATLLVGGASLSAGARMFVNGTLPPTDSTGIFRRIWNNTGFLTYDVSTGLTPITTYATDFSTPGTNVSLAAAATAPTQTINALRRTAGFTLTIGSTDTLTIASGMMLNTTGTGTTTGGTLAFGANPGVLIGTHFISSAITGSDGLIAATGTGTLSGNLSGLSGELSIHAATMNLNTNTFTGPIVVRQGTLNLNVSQTGAALGAITLGVPENEDYLIGTVPTLSFSGAGHGAVIDRDIIVDNGAKTAAGIPLSPSLVARLSPLSNTSGSQTINGDIVLRTSVNLQGGGGGAGSLGATVFTGNVTGPGTFYIPNGRVIFTPSSSIANDGGFVMSQTGFTAQVSFLGTGSGNGAIVLNGGNSTTMSYAAGALPAGPITVQNANASTAPTIIPVNNSTLNNQMNINAPAGVNVGTGITATWAGPINGTGTLTKLGDGGLVFTNNASTYTGPVVVNAGLLQLDGIMPGSTIGVAAGAIFRGTGSTSAIVTVNTGGAIAPGGSVGTLGIGDFNLFGRFDAEIDLDNGLAPTADLLNVAGGVSIVGGELALNVFDQPGIYPGGVYMIVANDGIDPVSGTFASITGGPGGFSVTVDYAFAGTDSLGRIGTGNDIAVRIIPEPSALALAAVGLLLARRRA